MNSDNLAASMIPVAAGLAVAVDEDDAEVVEEILTTLSRQQLYALAVVLAAHVDPEKPLVRSDVAGATKRAAHRAAAFFQIELSALLGRSRYREVLNARAVTYYAAYLLGDTYSQIGRVLNRDHSSVMSGCARVSTDPQLREVAYAIARDLGWDRNAEELGA